MDDVDAISEEEQAFEDEEEEVEIINPINDRKVGHFTHKHLSLGTDIDYSPYMFRLKVIDDEEE